MIFSRRLFLALLSTAVVVSLSACSTTPVQNGLADLPQNNQAITGFAIPIELKSENDFVGTGECILSANPNGSFRSFDTKFTVGHDIRVVEVPEGSYYFRGIHCDMKSWDTSFSRWIPFTVKKGKVSLLAGVHFTIQANGRNLKYRLSDRKQNTNEALELFGRLPETQKDKIISGYHAQPILLSDLQKPACWKHWELLDSKGTKLKANQADWPKLIDCYKGEAAVNGLWLGDLEINAAYENSTMQTYELVPGWSTLTPPFEQCVLSHLKAFHPPRAEPIRYHFYL